MKSTALEGNKMLKLIRQAWLSEAIFVVAKLGVADLLLSQPMPIDELAKELKVDERNLYRIMRALASEDIFIESDNKVFSLTPLAECLTSESPWSLRNIATMMCEEWHASSRINLMSTLISGDPVFDKINHDQIFNFLKKNKEAEILYDGAMTDLNRLNAHLVVEAYDFSSIKKVVDVAGGYGYLLSLILEKYADVSGVLFDRPSVVEACKTSRRLENDESRLQYVGGDFFKEIPAGGDLYMLRNIIHDWSDEESIEILKVCANAMKVNDAHLLLIEEVMDNQNKTHPGKIRDIAMMVYTTGAERTLDEFNTLLEAAGLQMLREIQTESSFSIIEVKCA